MGPETHGTAFGKDIITGLSLIGSEHRIANVDLVLRAEAAGASVVHWALDARPHQADIVQRIHGDREVRRLCQDPRPPDLGDKAALGPQLDLELSVRELDDFAVSAVQLRGEGVVPFASPDFVIDFDQGHAPQAQIVLKIIPLDAD